MPICVGGGQSVIATVFRAAIPSFLPFKLTRWRKDADSSHRQRSTGLFTHPRPISVIPRTTSTQLNGWSRPLNSPVRFRPRGVSDDNPSTGRPASTLTTLGLTSTTTPIPHASANTLAQPHFGPLFFRSPSPTNLIYWRRFPTRTSETRDFCRHFEFPFQTSEDHQRLEVGTSPCRSASKVFCVLGIPFQLDFRACGGPGIPRQPLPWARQPIATPLVSRTKVISQTYS